MRFFDELKLPDISAQQETFVRDMQKILSKEPALLEKFAEDVREIFSIQRISSRMLVALRADADYKNVVREISDLYLGALRELDLSENMKLAELLQLNDLFSAKYAAAAAEIYQRNGFACHLLAGSSIREKITELVNIKIQYFINDCSPIVIHVLGNNSREGNQLAIMEYEEILRQAARHAGLGEKIQQNIFIVFSSAGGKATEINLVDGFAIPGLSTDLHIAVDEKGQLLPATYVVYKSAKVSLQQFGGPEAVKIELKASGENIVADLDILHGNWVQKFVRDIPARLTVDGFFFGLAEAEINEQEFRKILQRKKLPLPQFIIEKNSFNTGDNCRFSRVIIEKIFADRQLDVSHSLITYTQKQQQGIRAATTAASQGQRFKLFFYLNPDYSAFLEYLPANQLLVYAMNLLKEILAEQSYVMADRQYHHPLPLAGNALNVALNLIRDIYNAYHQSACSLEEIDFAAACQLFNHSIWPQVERDLVPHQGNRYDQFLLTSLTPVLAKFAKRATPDEVQHQLANYLDERKTMKISMNCR